MKNQNSRQKMTAKIHIAKSQLGLDDDTYRAILQRVTGLHSCAKMTVQQLENVLAELKAKGFVDNRQAGIGRMPLHQVQHRAMLNKIAVLLKQTGKTWDYAVGTAKNMFDKDKLVQLNDDEMHKLTSALQIYTNRHATKKDIKCN